MPVKFAGLDYIKTGSIYEKLRNDEDINIVEKFNFTCYFENVKPILLLLALHKDVQFCVISSLL